MCTYVYWKYIPDIKYVIFYDIKYDILYSDILLYCYLDNNDDKYTIIQA